MKRTITLLMAVILAAGFHVSTTKAQTAYPYFPDNEVADDITSVATSVENPATALVNLSGNFTIEVAGTAGTEIKLSDGTIFYAYTPTATGGIRFVKKGSTVYVYEGSSYKNTITSQSAITYPEITDATATTSSDQLLQNASFETTGTLVGGTNYNFGTPWVTNFTVSASGGIRIGTNGSAVNGSYVCVWRGSGNSNYFAQPVSNVKTNTSYKVIVRQVASGNANASFNVGLGSSVDGLEFGTTTIKLGTTYDGTRSVTFTTSNEATADGYFTFKNTSTNTSSAGSDPLTQMDYIALVEGIVTTTAGITGSMGDVYYANAVYAPNINVNFAAGDYYDMTSLIVNPSFETGNLNGWTNNGMATQTNTPGQGWTKDGSVYAEKYVASTGNLPAAGISQTIAGLPNGVYKLKAAGHAIKQGATDPTATTGAYLYAASVQTLVNAGAEYEAANALVTNNSLTIGFKTEGEITSNWAAVDNFRLSYHGVDLTALNNLLAERVVAAQAILDATDTPKGYNKTELQTAIADAGTVEQSEEALNAAIAKVNAAITNYNDIVAAYAVLKDALDFAATLNGTDYPGKAAFDVAVSTAQGIYDSTDDKTAQDFTDATATLKAAITTYVLSQPASTAAPANITPMLANPGFDADPVTFTENDGTPNGTAVAGTYGYNIPGWDEAYEGGYPRVVTAKYGITFSTIPDQLNSTTPPETDKAGLAEGAALKMSGSWGSTAVLTQSFTLPAGTYVLSYEVINKSSGLAVGANRFGFVPDEGEAIYGATTTFAGTWTTETVTFTLAAETAGKISIGLVGMSAGAGSNGKLYIDNIRLATYGDVAIVTFNPNSGSAVASQYVDKGTAIAAPEAPTRSGFNFGGWYSDADLTSAWDFNMPVTESITLYAKWNEISTVATLSDLKVDGVTVDVFDAATYIYNVELPTGTVIVPEVAATPTDENAGVAVTDATALPGTTTVEVTAEDGITKLTYSVSFTVATATNVKPSDATAILVYPTVSKGNFTVDANGRFCSVTVTDLTGKVVSKQVGSSSQTISVAKAGIYLIKVECEGVIKFVKVVKNN
ncbi:MAG: InlB B-repeat-containing protein [Breznakibacter sp.]